MARVIVPQILRDDFTNYDYWSVCMRNYLLSQDLWDIIVAPNDTQFAADHRAEYKAWRIKNATALHAILTSCTPDIFSRIRDDIDSARSAWNALDNLYRKSSLQSASQAMLVVHDYYTPYAELVKSVHKGDRHSTERFLKGMPEAVDEKISSYGETALHMATRAGKEEIVRKLVKLMSLLALEIQDFNGDTALHLAAAAGSTKMAKFMVEKDEETRLRLVTTVNKRGYLPLTFACANGHRDATVYLFVKTPPKLLSIQNQIGSSLLQCAIQNKMLDIALEIIDWCYSLATIPHAVLLSLAALPDIFPSGSCRLRFWQQWMYLCICVRSPVTSIDVNAYIRRQSQRESNMITQRVLGKFGELREICSNFLKFLGIKELYNLKMNHTYSSIFLDHVFFLLVSMPNPSTLDAIRLFEVFKKAIEFGILELIKKMVQVYPIFLYTNDDVKGRTPIMLSILNRQEKVFDLFSYYGLDAYAVDESGNTILHFAGMLSPSSSQFDRISGPALQMQRELQWYKKVERIIYPAAKCTTNRNDETPARLFTKEHKQLMIEGVKWVKYTASSCTVVGALIITIMFAAAFTVPGGVFQDEDKGGNATKMGTPVFLGKKTFKTFIISDAISLFTSSASVVTFLGILTSSHGEHDFLESLPKKLIIGLSALFISLANMMVAFCAALILTLDGMVEAIIPLALLAAVPVTLFMFLQCPLLVEICMSTYGPIIFNRKIKYRH